MLEWLVEFKRQLQNKNVIDVGQKKPAHYI